MAVVVLSVGALAACGGQNFSATVAPVTTVPAVRAADTSMSGYDTVTLSSPAMQFAVPHTWKRFNLAGQHLTDIIRALATDNPKLANSFAKTLRTLFEQGARFAAANPNVHDGFTDNLNVLVTPAGPIDDAAEHDVRASLSRVGAIDLHTEQRDLHGSHILRAEYTLPLHGAHGVIETHGVQIYASDGSTGAVITVTYIGPGQADADTIANSVTIG